MIRVELEDESVALDRPAQARVYEGDRLITTIVARVECKPGADGGQYPAVSLEEQAASAS